MTRPVELREVGALEGLAYRLDLIRAAMIPHRWVSPAMVDDLTAAIELVRAELARREEPVAWAGEWLDDSGKVIDVQLTLVKPSPGRMKKWPRYRWIPLYATTAPKAPEGCEWSQQEDGYDCYSTACGHEFMVNEGAPSWPYCCYCAKPLKTFGEADAR